MKFKSDFVKQPIPKSSIEEIWKVMLKIGNIWMQWNPYGGRMSEISETETPFPHRAGYLFKIQYGLIWLEEGIVEKQVNLSREMYEAMTPYVTKDPREAYQNYRHLDIGSNSSNLTNFQEADPDNFFKHEQSIPPFVSL